MLLFKHRLALALGMTVAQLNRNMTHAELVRWMAYSNIEPFGYHADNWRMGMQCAVACNVWAAKGKAKKPEDFMPKSRTDERRQISNDVLEVFSNLKAVRDDR